METKTSLARYRESKASHGVPEYFYDNSRGSALLALCRAGMLPTRSQLYRSNGQRYTVCLRCGMRPETLAHVIFECNEPFFSEEELIARLALGEEGVNTALTNGTKRLLERWEKETRHIR